ncbi:Ig-like domain-containing protein [Natrarchaeobius chitinivorans]|uniref:Bacterial Ig domain-containing protein n=1 Tax=Natrarchaeobius chitinivorans TaxID=1679083 RepID=A0A3N6LV17_NATCH|nr:Ig-like domain-containing protein [Natrarchaeobius chitinivorans]RQG94173.1 hypothetical protein EA473_12410 [Natrarchaeobius chitinivorans]
MSAVDQLRSDYVAARDDVRRAEADRSKLLTELSHVEALFDASRRGDSVEDVATTVESHLALVEELGYSQTALEDADLLAARPTFADFGVERTEDVAEALERVFRDGLEGEFEDLLACLRDVNAAGGDPDEELAEHLDELGVAFEDDLADVYQERTAAVVGALFADGVRTEADLEDLLEAERGVSYGDDLLAVRDDDAYRSAAIDALVESIEAGDPGGYIAARRPFERTARALDTFAGRRRETLHGVTEDLADAYPSDHSTPHTDLDHETPVLLAPTRLETRFVRRTDEDGEEVSDPTEYELLVRVYPDDLHVDTHEQSLTDAEVEYGARFWERVWTGCHLDEDRSHVEAIPDRLLDGLDLEALPDDADERHAAVKERAWNELADRFGPERASWVKRELAPERGDRLLAGPDEVDFPEDEADVADYVAAFVDEMADSRSGVDRRPGSWTRPPRARLLPDQWIAFAETDGTEVTATSEPVQPPLSIGPDPGSMESAAETASEYDDFRSGEIEWVFDFDVAEDVGMALRLDLTEDQVAAGVDRLTVLGVSTGLDEDEATVELADLVEAHRYTDGLSILERGTPTNDTRENPAATTSSGDESVYERECVRSPVRADEADTDAVRAAQLLGLDPQQIGDDRPFVFDRVAGGTGTADATARATNAALWSATWGYYVPHLLVPLDWGPGVEWREALLYWLENVRRHFVEYVRGCGPLPPIRVGSQPYGIVPTTAYEDWSPIDEFETTPENIVPSSSSGLPLERYADEDVSEQLAGVLDALWETWEDASADVPSVDAADDPELVGSELLEMSGTSYGYRLRDLTGGEAISCLMTGTALQAQRQSAHDATADQLQTAASDDLESILDEDAVARVGDLFADQQAPVVDASVVGDDFDATLRALRTTPHGGLREGIPGTGGSTTEELEDGTWIIRVLFGGADASVAEALCYHAILQEYRLARIRIAAHYEHGHPDPSDEAGWASSAWSLLPEPQVHEDGDLTMWDALDERVPASLQEHPGYRSEWAIGDMLREFPEIDRPFAELIDAFEALEDADPTAVERRVRETVDLASHRYDAWATSLATRRLEGMRETAGDGLYVGAYGYVENLQRSDDDRSKGYIQAPSIDQATAAAVMRSAHEAETEEYGNLFTVDLSAERVRDARNLLAGVRAGYPLGELLGYRFERGLHENDDAELNKYVFGFRALAPLIEGSIDREEMADSDAAAERDVVDGVALYELWRDEQTGDDGGGSGGDDGGDGEGIPWGEEVGSEQLDLPDPESDDQTEIEEYEAITDELAAIEAAYDAVRDVLAAESVYQLVRDSPERAGAALDALARGEAIEDIEVLDTPRSGTSCTHRLVSLFEEDVAKSPWESTGSPRAAAEPTLEDWVGTLMGDPTRVACRAAYRLEEDADGEEHDDGEADDVQEDGGDDVDEQTDWQVTAVWLTELGLSSLDVVSLVEGDEAAWASELESRVSYHLQRTYANVGPDHEIRLSFAQPAEWPDAAALGVDPDDSIGFGELLEVARGVRSVLTHSRSVDARDLSVPGEATDDGQVVGDLDERANVAYGRLADAVETLGPQVALLAADQETDDRTIDDLTELIEALLEVPTEDLDGIEATLGQIDIDALQTELETVATAVAGSGVLVAQTDAGEVVISSETPTVEGTADPGETVSVHLQNNSPQNPGQQIRTATADEDGQFEVEFETGGLEPGDEVTITVQDESGERVEYTATYVDGERPPHAIDWPELEAFAAVVDLLEPIVESAEPVVAADETLDESAVDGAAGELDEEHWPDDAAADLDAVRATPSASFPGFDAPADWEQIAIVARAVAENDLDPERLEQAALEAGVPSTADLADLVDETVGGAETVVAGVEAAGRRPTQMLIPGTLEAIREALELCADYGIHGSVPLSATGSTRRDLETLARQSGSVYDEAVDRLDALDERPDGDETPADPDFYVDWLEALFGETFTVLVPFEPTNPGELGDALESDHSDALQEGDPLAVETWFDRIARVRDESRRFGKLLAYGEALGELSPADGSRFAVGQLPFEADDTWVGLPDAWDGEHPTGRLSVVSYVHGSLENEITSGTCVGLFVDELVETVPTESETTGLSVHYDRPANQAPQSMLLAVPPNDAGGDHWSVETLADVVRESVDMAKLRTVDRHAIDGMGQVLPGLAVATNESADSAGPDTASIDPDDLLADWASVGVDGGDE